MHPSEAFDSHERLEVLCERIGSSLEALARMRTSGLLSEERFVQAVLEIEAAVVSTAGFTLTATNTSDNWTVFTLRISGTQEPCASFEFLPETGEFRRPGSGPGNPGTECKNSDQ